MKQRISVLFSFIFFTISILHAQPFSVAYQDAEYVDTERADRTVNARIFYPSNQTGEALPVAEGTFPLIVFAHGFVMPYTAYNLYWESFVAEGYVVVMLDTETGISPSHQDYALDMVFLVEKLQAESLLEDSPFYQKLNGLSAVMGHSMGGGASFLAMKHSSAIQTMVTLAAAETNPGAIAAASEIEQPSLIIAGSIDCVTAPVDHQLPMYNALISPSKTYIGIIGGTHCQFASQSSVCELGELFCEEAGLSREEQLAISIQFALLWFNFHLKNQCEAAQTFQSLLATSSSISYQQSEALLCLGSLIFPNSREPLRIQAFPNPSTSQTSLSFNRPLYNGKISIINQQGIEVHSRTKINGNRILLSHEHWSAGLYHIFVEHENERATQSLLIH